jgi:hypothetical protein
MWSNPNEGIDFVT